MQGSDPKNSIGPYWERPGRTILDNHLVAIPNAEEVVPGAFKDFTRCYFTGRLSLCISDFRLLLVLMTYQARIIHTSPPLYLSL